MSTNVRKLRETKERIANRETSRVSPRTKLSNSTSRKSDNINTMTEEDGQCNAEMEQLRKQVQSLNTQIQRINQKQKDIEEVGNVTCNNRPYNLQFEIKLPIFHNELDDNPQKFLNEFKDYCQIKNISKNIVELLLGTALRDKAKIWFDANKEYVRTIEDFETEFKVEFFSIEQQVELRTNGTTENINMQIGR